MLQKIFISESDLKKVRNLVDTKENEFCGFLLEKDVSGKELELTIEKEGSLKPKGLGNEVASLKNQRGTCQLSRYTKYIWHTHPLGLKAYPSIEDILNMLNFHTNNYQNNYPYASIIFCDWGIWEILYSGEKFPRKESTLKKREEFLYKSIDKIFYTLHKESDRRLRMPKKGVIENAERSIEKLINETFQLKNPNKFAMNFFTWDEVLKKSKDFLTREKVMEVSLTREKEKQINKAMNSNIKLEDFFPKYPNVHKSEYSELNPYKDDFYEALFKKKEFYDNRLERVENFPKERGVLTKYQKTIARYMSSHALYDTILLIHSMGLGKTCSAVGAIEQIINEEGKFTGAIILGKGQNILDNFVKELVYKCTTGKYIPKDFETLTDIQKKRRIAKNIKFYHLDTFAKFAKKLRDLNDQNITNLYSNKIIVIDEVHNLRIQPEKKQETLEIYYQYDRFLHLVKGCKILLLSGTPMKDSPEEIASVANLILPRNEQVPMGADFLNEYMDRKENVYIMKEEKVPIFKEKMKGRVSFLRETYSNVPKEFIGNSNFHGLKHLIVKPIKMKNFQTAGYNDAYMKDKGEKGGIYTNTREASLFVYPDGSFGRVGFQKYITRDKTKLKSGPIHFHLKATLRNFLKGNTNEETLVNIRKCSVLYYTVISEILKTQGNCFIYSSIVTGSGAILFSLLLGLFGFGRAHGHEVKPAKRYAILTNKTSSSSNIRKIIDTFNKPENYRGEIIQVLVGSRAVSEGFSFNNVVFESVNTPHWNYSETDQALARGIRLGSHNDLIKKGFKPVVRILQAISLPKNEPVNTAIDFIMYRIAEDKDISIRRIFRILMENSFDCGLNYLRNRVNSVDGSRECDYTTCNFNCDGIDMSIVEQGLDMEDLDYSTYQLFYVDPKIPKIKARIQNLIRDNRFLSLESITKNLLGEFTEEEIRNVLFVLEEEAKHKPFDYQLFVSSFSKTPVDDIINELEKLFQKNFSLKFSTIIEFLPKYTCFELLLALRTMINDSVLVINSYGFPSYLKEEANTFFLIDNLGYGSSYYMNYYTEHPCVVPKIDMQEIVENTYNDMLPTLIGNVCDETDYTTFTKIMKEIPKEIQEYFIEETLIAKENKKENTTGKFVMKYFKSYIKKIDDMWISTLLREKNILRCKKLGKKYLWKDCGDVYDAIVKQYEEGKKEEVRTNNLYGIAGTYNPENNAFCLIDLETEKTALLQKRGDRRLNRTGKVCHTGWTIKELLKIVLNRLKIPCPKKFRENDSKQSLISDISDDSKLMEIYSKNKLQKMELGKLRNIAYWGTKKKGGVKGIKPLCSAIKDFLQKNNLVGIDNQCGVQGKAKKVGQVKTSARQYRIEKIIPSKNPEYVIHIPLVAKLMEECFKQKNFQIQKNDDLWLLVYLRKKLVAFVTLDKNNVIWNVCVAKNYRRQGIAQEAMKEVTNEACAVRGKVPTLLVDNQGVDYKKIVKMYESFGFRIIKSDSKNTYMTHPCK